MSKPKSTSRLRMLFSEEAQLEARISRDTRRLEILRSRSDDPMAARAATAAFERKRFSRKNYLMFIWDTLSATRGFEIWDSILAYARKFKLISGTLRAAAVLISILETGAVFIIAAGILLAVSPALILLLLAVHVDSLISGRRAIALVSSIMRDRNITFIFPPRGSLGRERFLAHNAQALAESIPGTVLIVSPYLFSSVGIGGKGYYSSVRKESDSVYLIRRQTYFKLKRRLSRLFSLSGTTLIYL